MELGIVQAAVLAGPKGAGPGFVLIYDADGLLIGTADPVTRERWDLHGTLVGKMRPRWNDVSEAGPPARGVVPQVARKAFPRELAPWYGSDARVDHDPRSAPQKKRPRA